MISIFCIINDENENINYFNNLNSIINQTYDKWELIICIIKSGNNSSIILDNIYNNIEINEYIIKNKIKIIENNDVSNINYYQYFELCLKESNPDYKYIGIYDINDKWHPIKIEYQLLNINNYDVIGCSSIYINKIISISYGDLDKYNLYNTVPFINSSTVIKKSTFIENYDIELGEKIKLYTMNKLLSYIWLLFSIKNSKMINSNEILVKHNFVKESLFEFYKTPDFLNMKRLIQEKYIRIKFFADFCTSNDCKKNYEKVCNSNEIEYYGCKKYIYFSDNNTYSHAIVLNSTIVPELKYNNIDKKNIIHFAFEPPNAYCLQINNKEFISYITNNIGKYYIGQVNNLPSPPFIGHHGFLWFNNNFDSITSKNKLMSIMVSQKQSTKGHKYRYKIAEQIIKLNLPIDIYGSGCNNLEKMYGKKNQIKGVFNETSIMYYSYVFNISIENTQYDHYFSEKLLDPFMFKTIPIYLGCNKVDTYFPNHVLHLSGKLENDIIYIKNIINDPKKYLINIDTEMVRNKINLIKNIDNIFNLH